MLCIECRRGFPCMMETPCSKSNIVEDEEERASDNEPAVKVQRSQKRDAALKDQQSTGRKRAARMYPLDRSAACEWRSASSETPMGGGEKPVTFGCNGLQQSRHHGPDKNTLNNDPGNVHRICHWHHNNWHILNDPDYNWANAGKVLRD